MNAVWRTIRGYILWQYERGTLHYDIMVTLILIFIFFSPRVINFNDKPIARNPHPTDVVVTTDARGPVALSGCGQRRYSAATMQAVRDQLLRIIEPISGAVSIVRYEPVYDAREKCKATKWWSRGNKRLQGLGHARMKHIRLCSIAARAPCWRIFSGILAHAAPQQKPLTR